MTISEMLKKVETYNEMSELMGVRFGSKAELTMIDKSVVNEYHTMNKGFKKAIKETYIDCCANAILNYKDYQFNTPAVFQVKDAFGSIIHMTVEFVVSEA